jgi:hypothetical protein
MARLGQDAGVCPGQVPDKKAHSKVYIRATGVRKGKLVDNIKQPQISAQSTNYNSQNATPDSTHAKLDSQITFTAKEQPTTATRKPRHLDDYGRTSEHITPKLWQRLRNKTKKVMLYWERTNLMIPNVFKMTMRSEEYPGHIVEFNDLSLKGILVMVGANSKDNANGSREEESDSLVNFTEEQIDRNDGLAGLPSVLFPEFDFGF